MALRSPSLQQDNEFDDSHVLRKQAYATASRFFRGEALGERLRGAGAHPFERMRGALDWIALKPECGICFIAFLRRVVHAHRPRDGGRRLAVARRLPIKRIGEHGFAAGV